MESISLRIVFPKTIHLQQNVFHIFYSKVFNNNNEIGISFTHFIVICCIKKSIVCLLFVNKCKSLINILLQ